MQVLEKAFGYITRKYDDRIQVLVFEQNTEERAFKFQKVQLKTEKRHLKQLYERWWRKRV